MDLAFVQMVGLAMSASKNVHPMPAIPVVVMVAVKMMDLAIAGTKTAMMSAGVEAFAI